MTVFASSTSTTVLVRTSFCRKSPYLCPRNSEPIWSEFRGLLCIGTSTVVGAPNCFKKEFIR